MISESGLGYLQKHMLNFIKKTNALYKERRRYSIRNDAETRRIATSLEKRGLIHINKDFLCWTVRIA